MTECLSQMMLQTLALILRKAPQVARGLRNTLVIGMCIITPTMALKGLQNTDMKET